MNKKLIALAVAGACVVPEAMAQTANPVTLYGRAYATFESVEAKGSVGAIGPVVRRNRVAMENVRRFGKQPPLLGTCAPLKAEFATRLPKLLR